MSIWGRRERMELDRSFRKYLNTNKIYSTSLYRLNYLNSSYNNKIIENQHQIFKDLHK